MTPAEVFERFKEREWRIAFGEWEMACLTHGTSAAFGGRYITYWRAIAGPFVDGVPAWRRGEPDSDVEPPGFDHPERAIIARYSPADVRGGRIAIKPKSDIARDWYRLTNESVPRIGRFPAQAFDGHVARVRVGDVCTDHKGLPCPPYSTVSAILGPVPAPAVSFEGE
jgi:hypothetical protein